MERPSIAATVHKLAMAGEQAGFSVEQIIGLLNAGIGVETLLDIIEWRLRHTTLEARSSGWIT